MTFDLASHTPLRPYFLPARLISAMRFRPAGTPIEGMRREGAGLNGADLRLLMAVYAFFGSLMSTDWTFDMPNAVLVRLYGGESQDRIERALYRLENTEIWTGSEWIPAAIWRHETKPVKAPDPRQVVGPNRSITLHPTIGSMIFSGSQRRAGVTSLRIQFADLQQLESRYAVSIFLKYKAWLTGQTTPHWEHAVHPKKDAISMDVPANEVPMVFGHDGKMAPSVMSRLFVTAGAQPALVRELRRVRLDMQVRPLMSRLRDGPLLYEVNVADLYTPATGGLAGLKQDPGVQPVTANRIRPPHRKKKAPA